MDAVLCAGDPADHKVNEVFAALRLRRVRHSVSERGHVLGSLRRLGNSLNRLLILRVSFRLLLKADTGHKRHPAEREPDRLPHARCKLSPVRTNDNPPTKAGEDGVTFHQGVTELLIVRCDIERIAVELQEPVSVLCLPSHGVSWRRLNLSQDKRQDDWNNRGMSKSPIWTPPKADKEPKFFCRVCRTSFITEAVYIRHVTSHSDDDIAEIRARHKDPVDAFYGPGVDPEWAAYNEALERAGIDPETQYNRGRRSNIRRASES